MKLEQFKNKLNDMLGDKHININDKEEVSKKNDNEKEQQRKVLNNIFDIYGDVFVKNNNN
tara:strand:+ start:338 stop:517 length:180 start_codon:yes stop_codon:yes gene_type:complete